MIRLSPLLFITLLSCELSAEKDPEGPADYDCELTITGSDDIATDQVLLESSTELSCVFSDEKSEYMEESCSLDMSNYTDYDDVNCDWTCSVITTCDEE
jgi:hypothetical protein